MIEEVVREIKEVKIQGATNIAIAGIEAFSKEPTKAAYYQIISARPTEPLLQNSLSIMLEAKNKKTAAKKIISYIKKSEEIIAKEAQPIIKDNMNIFVHCHSSTTMEILKLAKKKGKNFVVYNTEVRPLLQGRQSAEELASFGIKVIHLPDSAAELALKQCDLLLFGADAYLPAGVVNKVGTAMLCELAKVHKIPAYSCGISLKYSKSVKIEKRSGKELWDERNKLIEIENPAFDFTPKKFLSGIVSELGIHHYDKFVKEAKNNLKNFGK